MKLAIANTAIRQDSENRFSLNDLHVASGGEDRHQPSNFLRVEQTQALLAEISNSSDMRNKNPIVSKPGRYGGTYVAKELVYAYAMWISPKFSLEVIRTFDAVATGQAIPARKSGLTRSQVASSILILRSAAEDLKLSQSAVLGGYLRLQEQVGPWGILPNYATDAPQGSTTGSSEAATSATELLKHHGVAMSAVEFNKELLAAGILEEKTRPSSNGTVKTFKSVVDLTFGRNATSPNNERETQPLWFPSRFVELLDKLQIAHSQNHPALL